MLRTHSAFVFINDSSPAIGVSCIAREPVWHTPSQDLHHECVGEEDFVSEQSVDRISIRSARLPLILLLVVRVVWKQGLKNYNSASS
jgi:hypothetical protein